MSDWFRLSLGLGLMFFSGWLIHSALLSARNACVEYLRRSQQWYKDHPWAWDGPAEFKHWEASLLKYLTGERQGWEISEP